MKFAHKMILLYSALLLASYTVIAVIAQVSTSRILERRIRIGLEVEAFNTMQAIDRMLYERYLDLQGLAADPVISARGSAPRTVTQRLVGFRDNHPFYTSLALFDLDRIRIADTTGKDIGGKHPPTEYWAAIGAGREFVLAIAESSTTKSVTLYGAQVVKAEDGKPFGVLVARMPMEILQEIVLQFSNGDNVTAKKMELLDQRGRVLYSSYNQAAILEQVSEDWESIKDYIGADQVAGSKQHTWRNEEEISSFAQEQGYREFYGNGWILLLCTPSETALAPVAEQRELVLKVLLTVGCFALVAVTLLAKGMTGPLQNLSRQAREIGKGKPETRITVASRDELGELARAINGMIVDLRAGEKKYRDLVELLPQIVYEIDARGQIVFANQRGLSLFGYEAADLEPGLAITQLFADEELARLRENFEKVLRGQILEDVEYSARKKDGTTFPFLTFAVPVVRGNDIVGMRGIGIDLSERKRVESLVRIQRDLALALGAAPGLRAGLEICLDAALLASGLECGGIYLLDPLTGAIELISSRGLSAEFVAKVSHLEADSPKARIIMAGRALYLPYRELHPAVAAEELRERLRLLAVVPFGEHGRITGCLNLSSRALDDTPAYARESIETIAAQVGAAVGRLQAAKDLQQSEERFKDFADLLPQMVFETDSKGHYTYANRAAFAITGYTRETVTQAFNVLRLFTPADRRRVRQYLQRRLRGEQTGGGEYTALRKDGSTFPVLIFADPILHDDQFAGIRGIAIDISERKRAEAQIRQLNEELERKVAERTRQLLEAQGELVRKEKLAFLGQLAGSVGHELRNPLGVMSNAVYYLKTVWNPADAKMREYLDIIKAEIANSERIISDLLDFSRTMTPRLTTVSVPDLLRVALERCRIPQNIEVQVAAPAALPLLTADPLQLNQVLQNLIVNAVQAMPGGGTLTIAAMQEPDAGAVTIRVSDTGEGIRPENIDKLFQPLFTTKARGIGLGLAVSKQLVEVNGGRIAVESRAGSGTTFTVTLPA